MESPSTSRSLLERARDAGDSASWRRLTDLYSPLIRRWVKQNVDQPADIDDVVQEVLTALHRDLGGFEHNERAGAFRTWLRRITANRLRNYWQARKNRPAGLGDELVREALDQLEDPQSALSRAWDEEHDRHVTRMLLESIRLEFQPATWKSFDLHVRQGRPTAEVAAELGLTENAVLIAKSRVLKRLREIARGLLDD